MISPANNSNGSQPNGGFTEAQKNYLQGLAMGSDVARKVQGLPVLSNCATGTQAAAIQLGPAGISINGQAATGGADADGGVVDPQRAAQNRFLTSGKTLSKEEQAKRDTPPLDLWPKMKEAAREGVFPKGTDVFLWKFHGLFHVAPAQNAYMCRMRIPGGDLKSWQFAGVADIADEHAGGYVDVTTRANLQIREIPADRGCAVLEQLMELGIIVRGSGADNIRNVTSSATSGFDPQELIDTLPLAKEMHTHILNCRDLYGLPRKFNISFDGGGCLATLEDTNDIGFQAVQVTEATASADLPAGVYFRLTLGGITGHRDFARETGVLLKPEECVTVADAIVRVFIANGDRTNRKTARLKYLLDDWGFAKFLEETEKELGRPLRRVESSQFELPKPPDRWAHVGVHPQTQTDRHYIGVVLPVGRMTSDQVRGLASIADRYGSRRIRLTVWQNLIIPDIASEDLARVQQEIESLGLDWQASSYRSGLVACTGNAGCKYAASDTKRQAMVLASYLEERVSLDVPINMHLTGCHHSCAQHYIGDIGFRGVKVEVGEDMVEGYEVVIGGGYADQQHVARQLFPEVAFDDIPPMVERLINFYLEERDGQEPFATFARRQSDADLRSVALGNRTTKTEAAAVS